MDSWLDFRQRGVSQLITKLAHLQYNKYDYNLYYQNSYCQYLSSNELFALR
jgi:hypothetical protein